MAQGSAFLIGGGWNEDAFPLTYGRFVASIREERRIACVLLNGDDRDAYFERSVAAFSSVGAADVYPVFVSRDRPLRAADLEGSGGVFVGGGLTPSYHDAIVPDAAGWLPWLLNQGIPYGGFSAGAMIAPLQGIIGGWKVRHGATDLEICAEDVSEDEEYLDIRPGLGLVPFAVDVHASQYGTPTRLLHAVRSGAVAEGWAIDEDTMLEISPGRIPVSGLGSAYHVRRGDREGPGIGPIRVDILGNGDHRDIA